jgi:acetyltransferase
MLVIVTPQATTQVEEIARIVGQVSQGSDKPILGCFMGREAVEAGIKVLNRYRVPNYPVPERAVAALAAMMAHRRWRERPPLEPETFAVDGQRVRAVLDQVRAEGRVAIGNVETREIMAACDIPTPQTFLARTPDEAAHFAREIGFPVAIKIASPDILHKTDVGGVQLNVTSGDEARDAFELMTYRAGRYVPDAEIWGCLVQEMVLDGTEVLVSMNRDPHFGPLMRFGLGGIYGELLHDATYRLVPFDRRGAQEMISEVEGYNLLRGIRGQRRSDLENLAEALLRLAQLASGFPEILEFDINPLTVFEAGQGLMGIDMRLVLG